MIWKLVYGRWWELHIFSARILSLTLNHLSCDSCSRLTRTWELMKLSCKLSLVDSHATLVLIWPGHESFMKLSCPGQTRARVAWELTSESLHESFINSHVLVKQEQELRESWQARVRMRVSWNSHVLVKREQELHESWLARVYMRVWSTLMQLWIYEPKYLIFIVNIILNSYCFF